ncbi:hypothetical protein ACUVMQ_21535, partial [Aeromonas veronii]
DSVRNQSAGYATSSTPPYTRNDHNSGDLPRPHIEGRVLLPRADRRSMTVASALRQAGVPDLGSYLQLQVHRQAGYPVGPIMIGCHG